MVVVRELYLARHLFTLCIICSGGRYLVVGEYYTATEQICIGLHKLRMCPANRGESRQRVLWGRCPYSKSGSGYIEAGHGRHGHMGRTTWAISRGRGMGAKSQRGGVVEMCWVRFSCPAQTTRYHCTDRLLTPPATGQKPLPEKQMCLYLRLVY